jgi:hypothetical protein
VYVSESGQHARVCADVAARFLSRERLFAEEESDAIAMAIGSLTSVIGGGAVGDLLRSAGILDALGASGSMRGWLPSIRTWGVTQTMSWGVDGGMAAREYGHVLAGGAPAGISSIEQAFRPSFV